jgi:hypothetical protein
MGGRHVEGSVLHVPLLCRSNERSTVWMFDVDVDVDVDEKRRET